MTPSVIEQWVKKADTDNVRSFRQAIHTILLAISRSMQLSSTMVFHGGLLLTLKYQGIRHTKDLDFATPQNLSDIQVDKLIAELDQCMLDASESLPYGLYCSIQRHKVNPPGDDKSYQTLEINVGYAYKGTASHRRLLRKNCSTIISIDFSFNEINQDTMYFDVTKDSKIKAYSLHDLVAEKYRAIIQQKTRNRIRRQDSFDIYWLIINNFIIGDDIHRKILESLLSKSKSRGLMVQQGSLGDEDIIRRSKQEYSTLADEIDHELPPFDELYQAVRAFYESLPWNNIDSLPQ